MNIYRNSTWTKRDYETTNIVYQVAPDSDAPRNYSGQIAPEGQWVREENIPADMVKIGSLGRYSFYGYL